MLERDVEKLLVQGVKKLGGRAYKWVSPGEAGVPDRLVFLPGGRILIVELKTDRGVLSKVQKLQHKRLKDLGREVITLYGEIDVRDHLKDWERYLQEKGLLDRLFVAFNKRSGDEDSN